MYRYNRDNLDIKHRIERIDRYRQFCETTYVPIFSKPWWMNAVCGDSWDVWLYSSDRTSVQAAMPFYFERRGEHLYITKAKLSQNNGVLFKYDPESKEVSKAAFQERVVNSVCNFLETLDLDVYEQQFVPEFTNWQPYFWNGYTALPRYTYRINTSNMKQACMDLSSNYRRLIRKGEKNTKKVQSINEVEFYEQQRHVYNRQNLSVPFTFEFFSSFYKACMENNTCEVVAAYDKSGQVAASLFTVWDEKCCYLLMGGANPEKSFLGCYTYLIWNAINKAAATKKIFDFEGSMIKRIAKSYREFGAVPTLYFRIRKVFNPVVIMAEAKETIDMLKDKG